MPPPDRSPTPITRIQRNLLAVPERRLLTWLCSRMPTWVTPDVLTAAGLAGALAVFAGYAASAVDRNWLWLAIIGYVLHWFGDSMDGSLARYRQIERPSFGYFVDHSCDGFATLLILAGLGLSPFVRLDVALLVLAGYLLLSIHAFLSARILDELRLSYVAAGPTELRLVLIVFTLTMFIAGSGPRVMSSLSTYDVAAAIGGMALITLFVVQCVFTARRIAAKEHAGEM
jgi:phosphatidylglycerophosphate synthase